MTTLNPVEFATGGYDFTIQVLREGEAPPGYTAHKLSEVDVFPVCSPALAERLRKPQDLTRTTLLHCAPRPELLLELNPEALQHGAPGPFQSGVCGPRCRE